MRDLLITCAAFGLLFAVQATLITHPHGKLAHRLYPPLFAGLYLDELFTRFTFKVWPAKVVNQ
jgi:NAD(P)H-quinone oxidoreductase subunit 5